MKRVVIFGGTGMLGSMLAHVLSQNEDLDVHASFRTARPSWADGDRVNWFMTSQVRPFPTYLQAGKVDWVINAAGLIRHKIELGEYESTLDAIMSNSVLPYQLAAAAESWGAQMLQIATDCVYSGSGTGSYSEWAEHDEASIYGRTKSLGEVRAPWVHHLRCSIVGPEAIGNTSLLQWFLSHEDGDSVSGYTNHLWNGLTTLEFSRLAEAIVLSDSIELPDMLHVVPKDVVSKHELLCLFAKHFGRNVEVNPVDHGSPCCRTLSTCNPSTLEELWRAAGREAPPSIEDMVEDLAKSDMPFRLTRQT